MNMKKMRIRKTLRFLVRTLLLVLISFNLVLTGVQLFIQKEQKNVHSLSEDVPLETEAILPSPSPVPTPLPTTVPATPSPTPEPVFEEMDGYVAVNVGSIYDNPQLAGNPIRHVVIRSRVHISDRIGDALAIEVTESSVPEYGTKGYMAISEIATDRDDILFGNTQQTPDTIRPTDSADDLGFGADTDLPNA